MSRLIFVIFTFAVLCTGETEGVALNVTIDPVYEQFLITPSDIPSPELTHESYCTANKEVISTERKSRKMALPSLAGTR